MSIGNQEKEAYIVDQVALSELQRYNSREQTMFETMQKIGELDLGFTEWQFLYEEASNILDKQSFKMFRSIALDKMLDLAKSFRECLVVCNLAKKGGKMVARVLEKMVEMPKSEKEKLEMEHLIEENA